MKFKSLNRRQYSQNLEEMSRRNKDKRDQINNQSKASRVIEGQCKKKLISVQQQMKNFARLIQVQVKKNQDLKVLLKNVQQKLSKGKSFNQSSQDGANLEQLLKKKKKLQYDLQQIIQKNNQALADIRLLKEQVNTAREQRVIYSSIFKNLQRQIRVNEQQFKKLIIQKYQVQKQKNETIKFYHRQEQLRMNPQKSINEQAKQSLSEQKIQQKRVTLKTQLKPIDLKLGQGQKKQPKKKQSDKIAQQVQLKRNYLHQIKTQVGIDDLNQLIQLSSSIDQKNKRLYQQSNQIVQQIDRLNAQLIRIQEQIDDKKKMNLHYKSVRTTQEQQQTQSLKAQCIQLDNAIQQEQNQFKQILVKVTQLGQVLDIKPQEQLKQKNLKQFLSLLEIKLIQHFKDNQTISRGSAQFCKLDTQQPNLSVSQILQRTDIKHKETDKIFAKNQFMDMGNQQIKKILKSKKLHKRSKNKI